MKEEEIMRTVQQIIEERQLVLNWVEIQLQDMGGHCYTEEDDMAILENEVNMILNASRDFMTRLTMEELKLLTSQFKGTELLTKGIRNKLLALVCYLTNKRGYYEKVAEVAIVRLASKN